MNQVIAIDPGLTSGVAILKNYKGLYKIETNTVALDRDDMRIFMDKHKDCRFWVIEKPIAYSPMAAEAEMCMGYWCCAIDFICHEETEYYVQYPKEREKYMKIAKSFGVSNHMQDALAHLLKHLDKTEHEIYEIVTKKEVKA